MNTSLSDSDRLLSVQEAADYLGVSKYCLDAWRSRGKRELPYVKIGSRVKYPLEALRGYIRERTVSH